jgi:hypothetical protein
MVRDRLSSAVDSVRERVRERRFEQEFEEQVPESDLREQVAAEEAREEAKREARAEARKEFLADVKKQRKQELKPQARERLEREVSPAGREDTSSGFLGRLAAAAKSVGDPTPRGPGGGTQRRRRRAAPDDQDRTLQRAYEAGHVSPPTDHSVSPVDDRGLGSFADFVTGTRPAEGMARFQQTTDNSTVMEWRGSHSDGSETIVTAYRDGGQWSVTATEIAPSGRRNGGTVIGKVGNRSAARERALDWIEDNPEGIPLHQQAGQFGAAGFATGESYMDNPLVFGDGGGDGAGGGLVNDDDLDFITGGNND